MVKNIGFVSTRFAGTDGVTLESSKWAEVLEQKGHQYTYHSHARPFRVILDGNHS